VGNGASIGMLSDAGIEEADVFIAVTESDELNLLCCMFAKKAGHCHAIARVRNPSYSHELEFIKQQIGISAIINPEMAAAKEISRLLRFPGAAKIDTFAEGRVRLIKFVLTPEQGINGMSLQHIRTVLKCDVLICAVEREGNVVIPDGKFTLHNGDVVTFLATQDKAREFFTKIHLAVRPVHNAMLVGGGAIGYYLAKELIANKIQVRIVERSPERCDTLTEMLPEAQILCGDGSNRELLMSEGLPTCEAFVALTNIDEENVLLTLFAKKHSRAKLVTKVNRLEFDDILGGLELGSTIYPKYMTCDYIVQYVRALQNEAGSNVKTLYRILDDRVEALEFTVHEESAATRAPLSELRLKPNQLVCCITRGDEIIIPRGSDQIRVGDSVIVVTLEHGLHDVRGIVAE
jgi:trk system potassium uptake protein TrkA